MVGIVVHGRRDRVVGVQQVPATLLQHRRDLPVHLRLDPIAVIADDLACVDIAAEREAVSEAFEKARHVHTGLHLHRLQTIHAGLDQSGH